MLIWIDLYNLNNTFFYFTLYYLKNYVPICAHAFPLLIYSTNNLLNFIIIYYEQIVFNFYKFNNNLLLLRI